MQSLDCQHSDKELFLKTQWTGREFASYVLTLISVPPIPGRGKPHPKYD